MTRQSLTYHGWDRKLVEVLVDDQWHPGELRSWDQADDGTWSGIVAWSAGVMDTRLDRFPADLTRIEFREIVKRGSAKNVPEVSTRCYRLSSQQRCS